MKWIILLVWSLVCVNTYAHESDTLSVDRIVPKGLELAFPNEERSMPKSSGFELEHYVLMSNDKGERWAVVTIKNSSRGNRQLEQQHLMAVFADGSRAHPEFQSYRFKAEETLTLTVYFGESKFPILSVYTHSS